MIGALGITVTVVAILAGIVGSSPGQAPWSHRFQQDDLKRKWEHELLELKSTKPINGIFTQGDLQDPEGIYQIVDLDVLPYSKKINKTNFAEESFLPSSDDIYHSTFGLPSTLYSATGSDSAAYPTKEESKDLRPVFNIYGYRDFPNPRNHYLNYPVLQHDFQRKDRDQLNSVSYKVKAEELVVPRDSSHKDFYKTLTQFFKSSRDRWPIKNHRNENEVDFENIWELNAIQPFGKKKNNLQELVHSVGSEADENLMEILVRIAEKPVKWQNPHEGIKRLDQALESSDEVSRGWNGVKGIEKRSSSYADENHFHRLTKNEDELKKKKFIQIKKKERKKHFPFQDWERIYHDSDKASEKQKLIIGNNLKSANEIEKKNGKSSANENLWHLPSHKSDYGEDNSAKFENWESSEKSTSYDGDNKKPKSAAYASVIFSDEENKDFGQWKIDYQPIQPEDLEGGVLKDYKHPQEPLYANSQYNRYSKKKLKMKSMAKNAAKARTRVDKKTTKTTAGYRRWQLLKFKKHFRQKWTKPKDDGVDIFKKRIPEEVVDDKRKTLATDHWVTSKDQKENWPHFVYHRVTSSPNFQQRKAGKEPRHQSAYVAVSVVPTNSTVLETSNIKPQKVSKKLQNLQKESELQQNDKVDMPHLLYQLLDQPSGSEKKLGKLLKDVEDKFNMREEDRVRLQRVMRDAGAESNQAT